MLRNNIDKIAGGIWENGTYILHSNSYNNNHFRGSIEEKKKRLILKRKTM
jgi:hypothetical protein